MKTFDIIVIIVTIVFFLFIVLLGTKAKKATSMLAIILISFVFSYSLLYGLLLKNVLPIDVTITGNIVKINENKIYLAYIFFSLFYLVSLLLMLILRKIRLLFKGKFMSIIDSLLASFSLFFILTFIHYSFYKSGLELTYFDSLIENNEFLLGLYSYFF